MSRSSNKNYTIELYRFIFTFIVFILHFKFYGGFSSESGPFIGGYLSVEFFFLLSGFTLAQSATKFRATNNLESNDELSAFRYLVSRYKRIIPQYWLSILLLLMVSFSTSSEVRWNTFFPTMLDKLYSAFPELLGLQLFWRPSSINYFSWFISAMLWSSFVIYYLLLKRHDLYVYILAPLFFLFGITYFENNFGTLDVTEGISALLRAFIDMGIGCVIYEAYVFIKKQKYQINPFLLTIIECFLLYMTLTAMYSSRHTSADYMVVFWLSGLILVTFLNRGYITRLLNHRIFGLFGAASLAIYLNQRSFYMYLYRKHPNLDFWPTTIILFLLLTLFSFATTKIEAHFIYRKSIRSNSTSDRKE